MKPETKRLFINNLDGNITEEDIREKFSNYGTVTSVEVKERKNPVGSQTQFFAYINVKAEDRTLQRCIEEFANKKWKGQFFNLQLAKESFIDRLKREREENHVKDTQAVVKSNSEIKPINININKYQNRKSQNFVNEQVKVNICNDVVKIDNYNEDNEKRLKSLMHMKEGYRQQKQYIKNALSNIDATNSNKKVRFDAIEESNKPKNNAKNRMDLFDEDEGDDNNEDINFEVQHQFEGVKGQKLMQLQSRFQNDERFKMDSRFLDEFDEQDQEENDEINAPEDEKEKQLEILESVLGEKLKRPSTTKEVIEKKKSKMMLRFDPSQPQHSQFEVQQEVNKETKPKKKEKKVSAKPTEELKPLPEVSKETFYKVTSDLKSTLNEKEEFSLSKLFSSRIEQDLDKQETEEYVAKPKVINKKQQIGPEQKVFKYDSSDDEEGDDSKTEDKSVPVENKQNKNLGLQIKPRMWTETFFFKDDDYRLQEGFDFIKRLQLGEQENFKTVRRNLKEIIRAKVKNNLRKNRPFKRKLGGNKKRLKVKRALKR